MRALRLVGPSQFAVTDAPRPEPQADEVLIRVAACGICGSDVHGMNGSTGRRIPPIVMGHEAAGTVEAGTDEWPSGTRVTFDSTRFCGECPYCFRGEVNLCDRRRVFGVSCAEYRQDGAFAEYVAVPARGLYRLPDELSFEVAAFAEPVAIALHAVNRSGIEVGQSAAVFGVGMIGLLIVQALRERGASPIVAVDLDEAKLALAREFGATTETQEVDVAFEAVGIAPTVKAAVETTRKGGTVVLVGNLSPSVELPLQAVVTRELNVLGSAASAGEYPEALAMLADGRIDVSRLLSETVGLDEAPDRFARLAAGEKGLMKVMVTP